MFHKRNRWHYIAYDVERKRKLNYLKEDTTVPLQSYEVLYMQLGTEIHEKIHNKLKRVTVFWRGIRELRKKGDYFPLCILLRYLNF